MAQSWQALNGRYMATLKWAMPRLAHGKPEMAGKWLALIGPFNGWLTASLKWQRNGSPEVGHLRLAHGKP